MKLKGIITASLLFVLAFSIVHEYAFALHSDHCTVTEYVSELDAPVSHGDLCDIHFEYHQAFLLTESFKIHELPLISSVEPQLQDRYNFKIKAPFYKPPIA